MKNIMFKKPITILTTICFLLCIFPSCTKENSCIDNIDDIEVVKLTDKSKSFFKFTGKEQEFIYKDKSGKQVRNLRLDSDACIEIDYSKYPKNLNSYSETVKAEYREIRFYDEANGTSDYINHNITYRLETRLFHDESGVHYYDRYCLGGNLNRGSRFGAIFITDSRDSPQDFIDRHEEYTIHKTIELNNKSFDNVYEFVSRNSKATLYFSPEIGIIGFVDYHEGTLSNGRLFVLDKII